MIARAVEPALVWPQTSKMTGYPGSGRLLTLVQVGTERSATVVFLDDNEDLRELMSILLKNALGLDCLCFANLEEIQSHEQEVLKAKLAILDINLGPFVPDGLDAFHWLKAHGFHGKVFFLTGHARNNPRMKSADVNGAKLLEKPLRPDQLVAYVAQAVYESR